jgi:parallel beta-helix repeat protein
MKSLLSILVGTLSLVLMEVPDGSAVVRNVPGDAPTIQAGIDSSSNSDTVLVAPGTYSGLGNRNLNFSGKAIVVLSSGGASVTTIDAGGSAHGFVFTSGEPVSARVDGFTIRNGYGEFGEGGGGVYCKNGSSPTIANCIIRDCVMGPGGHGGGVACEGSSPVIVGCAIIGNTLSGGSGGGIFCFSGSAPTISGCVISGNEVTAGSGGAISCSNSAPSIENTIITGNHTALSGGGLALYFDSTPSLINCTLAGNRSDMRGGGILSAYGSDPMVTRTIIRENCASEGNEVALGEGGSDGAITLTCSAIDSSGITGDGSIVYQGSQVFDDPLFCGPASCESAPSAAGEYTLDLNSPCLPSNSPCGELIGALGEGCGVPGATEVTTWGGIKSRFR